MSYDVSLVIDTGDSEPHEVASHNHTSNTARMWRAAGCDIAEFHGKSAVEFHAALTAAIIEIAADPDAYRQYDATNGWGDLESTLGFLRDLQGACARHPKTTVAVSR